MSDRHCLYHEIGELQHIQILSVSWFVRGLIVNMIFIKIKRADILKNRVPIINYIWFVHSSLKTDRVLKSAQGLHEMIPFETTLPKNQLTFCTYLKDKGNVCTYVYGCVRETLKFTYRMCVDYQLQCLHD